MRSLIYYLLFKASSISDCYKHKILNSTYIGADFILVVREATDQDFLHIYPKQCLQAAVMSHLVHLQLQVQVSMMFGGESAVEVNPKINVEELKSFTSMSLYIKLQKDNPQLAASPDRFILYLGNKNVRE